MSEDQIVVQLNPDVPPTGSDLGVVNAARRSFGKRSELDPDGSLKPADKRLLEFLARGMTADDFEGFKYQMVTPCQDIALQDKSLVESLWKWRNTPTHEAPFGHAFLSFELKVPLFLARQLVKHKFLRWSEFSRRYITDDVEFYKHTYRVAAENKKQGSGGAHPTWNHGVGTGYMEVVSDHYTDSVDLYNRMVFDGVSPEQARGVLPADLMTSATWSGSLDAFANMCRLRLGSDAQREAQVVAGMVYSHLEEHFPISARSLVYGC